MKLKAYQVSTKGEVTQVEADWHNQMRQPVGVEVAIVSQGRTPHTVLKGDRVQSYEALAGLAEIAWSMGWRPRGFPGFISAAVAGYKIPKEA